VAYKPNTAFYEALGKRGWEVLYDTVRYIRTKAPDVFVIADAKRGDIGNTARHYARAFYDELGADAVTVAPYMGRDSVEPFLEFPDKMCALLALTSNPGAADFERTGSGGMELYERVVSLSQTWKNAHRLMYVMGATRPEALGEIRNIIPGAFLLVPGVGAQGGDLHEVVRLAANEHIGLIVNVSRSVLYASGGEDFAVAARREALVLQSEMAKILEQL